MNRDLAKLASTTYDVLVVGGGIHGVCVAWDATLRGLSVALVEKGDFGHATSANSLKTIHGGLRYLQQADLKRMRESIRERTTLMRIAPHLAHPLPCLMPTYGHALKGREGMAAALLMNDLVGFDRNRLADPQKHLPGGRILSRRECLEVLPGIPEKGLTGGAVWYDAQMYNSERLTLSFLKSATKAGADAANYVEATGFVQDGQRVIGVQATDLLHGGQFEIRADAVVNTSGPWVDRLLHSLDGRPGMGVRLAKAINLVTRPLVQTHAAAIPGPHNVLFFAPWRDRTLIGTTYTLYDGDPDDLRVTEADITRLLGDVNDAWPAADLHREDVLLVHAGLVPVSGLDRRTGQVKRAGHYRIADHRRHGLDGVISVLGVKYTTARDVAEKAVDVVFRMRGQRPPRSLSSVTPLYGGAIERFDAFLRTEIEKRPHGLGEETVRHLVYNYGAAYPEVLRYMGNGGGGGPALTESLAVLKAEVLHGVREEMAHRLTDIVFRRTELGTAGSPDDEALRLCVEVMAGELGWSQDRLRQQLREVLDVYAVGAQRYEGVH